MERKRVWMTVHHSHHNPPPQAGKTGRSEESRWRERWEKGIKAARIFYCKCCIHTVKGKREGGRRAQMDGGAGGAGGGGGDRVARCDVQWPELFSDAINLEARLIGFERGERYKLSLATGSVASCAAGQGSVRTLRNVQGIVSTTEGQKGYTVT